MAQTSQPPMTVDLQPVQLVAADGTPTPEHRYSRELPAETLSWLYEMMVLTRELDGEFVNLKRQGQLALFASCRGQEAAQVGATACLRKTDWLFPQYRELGAFLVRGIPPGNVGAVWRGTWHGGLGFTDKCCAPLSIPIGTQTLHAVGAAMAAQRLGEDSVTIAFLGDGATSGKGTARPCRAPARAVTSPGPSASSHKSALKPGVSGAFASARGATGGRPGRPVTAAGAVRPRVSPISWPAHRVRPGVRAPHRPGSRCVSRTSSSAAEHRCAIWCWRNGLRHRSFRCSARRRVRRRNPRCAGSRPNTDTTCTARRVVVVRLAIRSSNASRGSASPWS